MPLFYRDLAWAHPAAIAEVYTRTHLKQKPHRCGLPLVASHVKRGGARLVDGMEEGGVRL